MKVVIWHGEHRTLYYIVERGEIIFTAHSMSEAELYMGHGGEG